MLDYFDLVKQKLVFDKPDTIYMIDITYRRVDHRDNWVYPRTQYPVKWFCIKKTEDLDTVKPEVIALCEAMGARAYINTSPRYYLDNIRQACDNLKSDNFIHNKKELYIDKIGLYLGTCPSYDVKYTIDVDTKDIEYKQRVIDHIDSVEGNHDWYWFEIETNKGYHIYAKPFNTTGFKAAFPLTDIVENRGILLYFPQSLTKNE